MEFRDEILAALLDENRFVRLTFSRPAKAAVTEWLKAAVRPVRLSDGRRLQIVFQGPRKQIVRNVRPADIESELDALLGAGFGHINLQCTDGDLHIRITAKGRVLASRGKGAVTAVPDQPHDRRKEHPFPEGEPNAFLESLGIIRDGRVLPSMRDKFRQINHFLDLLSHSRLLQDPPSRVLRMVDCGCGRALLTLAACHYLRTGLGLNVSLTGLDENAEVITAAEALRARTDLEDVQLSCTRIADFQPPQPPDIVLSLHACDTATDDALAQGVKWRSPLILAAPCCQHELHHQIKREEFRAALRHGILRERLADILTDSLRAAALRVMGYVTDVIEFIAPSHTSKNLMIRAERDRDNPLPGSIAEYIALRDFWEMTPAIEASLGADFRMRLGEKPLS